VAVLVVVALVALVRLRVADVPLERDEGEYAYAGQLILQGIPPYRLAYNMKFPGTYYAYAAILALLGQTAWGIHVGLLLVNAATTVVLFFLGRRLIGPTGAAVAAAAFAVLSLDRWIMGVFAHATHFVLLPALAGLLVLLRAQDAGRPGGFLAAGALIGMAVLMKQHAVVFLPLAVTLVLWPAWRHAARSPGAMAVRTGLLVAGAAVPFVLVCAVLAAQGVLGTFWFWAFQYAREYVSEVPVSGAWSALVESGRTITQATLPLWGLAGAGLVALWGVRWKSGTRVALVGLLAASLLAVCPGFYFRPHYFILLLPAAALFAGVAVASIAELLGRVAPPAIARAFALAVFVSALGGYVAGEQRYLWSMTPRELSRSIYGPNPFVEAVDIGRYVRERTPPDGRIAVVGSEPEIYFYAHRTSATGYIYTFPLMESQRYARQMQDEMMREIEAVYPQYVVLAPLSVGARPTSDPRFLDWARRYVGACYEVAGIVDVHSKDATTTRWDGEVSGYRPRSPYVVYTFRRSRDAPCVVAR
jgi:4-amino-4-deoxy-L-arabinose transferase-like glycosyltransferase